MKRDNGLYPSKSWKSLLWGNVRRPTDIGFPIMWLLLGPSGECSFQSFVHYPFARFTFFFSFPYSLSLLSHSFHYDFLLQFNLYYIFTCFHGCFILIFFFLGLFYFIFHCVFSSHPFLLQLFTDFLLTALPCMQDTLFYLSLFYYEVHTAPLLSSRPYIFFFTCIPTNMCGPFQKPQYFYSGYTNDIQGYS